LIHKRHNGKLAAELQGTKTMANEGSYSIYRYYINGDKKLIKKYVSLIDAQKHCNDPKTKKDGKWFDGYTNN
jgi:hypothetical protein